MEHRFRGIKLQAELVRRLVAHGEDPGLYEELTAIRTKEGKTSRRSPLPTPLRFAAVGLTLASPLQFPLPFPRRGVSYRPVFERSVYSGEKHMLT